MADTQAIEAPEGDGPKGGDLVKRHRLSTRLWHWINVVAIFIMLGTGMMIFNAHPRLYWGHYGANFDYAWLELPRFPGWATIPSTYNLALARHWHLFFAWVFAFGMLFYMVWSLFNGHFKKDMALSKTEVAPSHLWHGIKEHARLRFPTGVEALKYNPIQKITYSLVMFVFIPVVILTGMTMAPGLSAAFPWLVDLFQGRQSARSIHFIIAACLVAFIIVHLILVVLAGPINEIRAMITGNFRLPTEKAK